MIEYDIIWDFNINDLIKSVRQKTKEGWEPIGGISSNITNDTNWCGEQAMIRPKKEENEDATCDQDQGC